MTPGAFLDRLSEDGRWSAALWLSIILMVAGWAWLRLGSAQADVDQALQRHHTLTRDIQRLAELRRQTVDLADGARLNVDLVSRAQRALTSVGLSATACQGVQPRADQANLAGGPRMQSVELNLSGLTPGEFGSWLAAWNTPDQPWLIREVVLNHQAGQAPSNQGTNSLDSNRFQITVLLSAPSVEDAP